MHRLLSLSVLCACSGDDPAQDPCDVQTPSVEIGTGEFEYAVLGEQETVTLVNGPQGGWHIWVAGRMQGLHTEIAAHASARDVRGDVWLAGSNDAPVSLDLSETGVYDTEQCSGELYGHRAYLDDAALPQWADSMLDLICYLEDRPIELMLTLTDLATGQTASDTATVLGALDPANVSYCRERF